ncbi:alpha/beta fold hydrolase [Corynebacterium sp. H128]|uniref:alpha/beta fold hydrolase n=1 Tax=unclassified Corynebacterium TaxID=2624378 RepID=UPI0030A9AF08
MKKISPTELALPGPFEHELVHTRGTRLHAAVAGDTARPLLLLLHDCLGGWFDFRHAIAPAAQHFHVAAMSARGFDLSDKPPSGYSMRHAVGDVNGMIRALGHGAATVVAVGSAARVATTLAANYPERVRGLQLIDPLTPRNPLQSRLRVLHARACQRLPEQVALRSLLPHHDAELRRLRALSYAVGGTQQPRVRHARLALVPLPLNWTAQPELHIHQLTGMPFLKNPEEWAESLRTI